MTLLIFFAGLMRMPVFALASVVFWLASVSIVACLAQRAMSVFANKPLYDTLRANAVESVMDLSIVGLAWYEVGRGFLDLGFLISEKLLLCTGYCITAV